MTKIQLTSQNGHTSYGIKEFVVSTEADIENLPVEGLLTGSTAFVIETSSVYMFDETNSDYWVKI